MSKASNKHCPFYMDDCKDCGYYDNDNNFCEYDTNLTYQQNVDSRKEQLKENK